MVHLPATFLHAVVAQEILTGAGSRTYVDLLQARFVTPFERRRRVVAPSYAAWKQAGKVVSRLVELKLMISSFDRAFLNDVLLAVSCREAGHTLITRNQRDFDRIGKVMAFDYRTSLPA